MLKALVYILPVALAAFALIELSRSGPAARAQIPTGAWLALIVLLPVVGPVAWILLSRSRAPARGAATRGVAPHGGAAPGWAQRHPSRPLAPDDDPEFLWNLEMKRRRTAAPAPAEPDDPVAPPATSQGEGQPGGDDQPRSDPHAPDEPAT